MCTSPRLGFSRLVVALLIVLGASGAVGVSATGMEEPVNVRVDDVFFDTFIRDALSNISTRRACPLGPIRR